MNNSEYWNPVLEMMPRETIQQLQLKKFKEIFYQNIYLFLEGEYLKFFQPFKEIKGMDENYIKEIYQDIQIKLTAMHDAEFDNLILYTIVLSSLISNFSNVCSFLLICFSSILTNLHILCGILHSSFLIIFFSSAIIQIIS